jgi:hypothetical protein
VNPLKPPYISFSRSGAGRSCGCAPAQVTPSTMGAVGSFRLAPLSFICSFISFT